MSGTATLDTLAALAPLATPLPDAPEGDVFTKEQWTTLMAIFDTVIPSIRSKSTKANRLSQLQISDQEYNKTVANIQKTVYNAPDVDTLDNYFDEKASDYPEYQEWLKRTFALYIREDGRAGLAFILSAMNTRVGSLVLTGYATPFFQQPIAVRQNVLLAWRDSYLPPLRGLFKQMTQLGKMAWIRTSPQFQRVSGFPKHPDHYKPGEHYKYEFLQFAAGTAPEIIETDVVIVGSGCGGSVCAKNLAEAGNRVVVLDKGYYFKPEQLPMSEIEGAAHLFENGGFDVMDDNSASLVTGSTWGGGGVVNWSASLQTQSYVRKEWAQDRGLKFFESAEFQSALDRVCTRMGVSTEFIKHNHRNQMLLEGSRKLGYSAKAVPQNSGGKEHSCGYCTYGCGAAEKAGPTVTWLPDAGKAGAKFVEGFKVDHVIFDESSGKKVATGVKGVWTSRDSKGGLDGPNSERTVREVIVRAKKVIISCGTMWSPIVLLNSGIKNKQIGRNLYLHPVNVIAGIWPEDIRPWEGGILTSVCTSFENLDGHGHGVKIETLCAVPGMFLPLLNWESGADFKTLALKYRHANGFIIVARDRDTGRIYKDAVDGRPRIEYTPSAFDRKHIMEGNIAVAKICYVTGATEIHAAITGVKPFIRNPEDAAGSSSQPPSPLDSSEDPGITDPRFSAWLEELQRIGNAPPEATFPLAHQMGSNRMSVKQADGVVDPKGRVWGTEGLYVSDASIFPSASGVNPMVTNMAISDWISRGIVREIKAEARASRL